LSKGKNVSACLKYHDKTRQTDIFAARRAELQYAQQGQQLNVANTMKSTNYKVTTCGTKKELTVQLT